MNNYNQEIINIAEKICDMFLRNNLKLMDDEKRNSFVSEMNTLFEALYDSFKNIPDNLKKTNMLEYIEMKQNVLNTVLSLISELSIDYAKKRVNEMKEYLINNLSDISIDDGKKYYLNKLTIYKNALDRHKELENNYKNRSIKYDTYIGSYNALVSIYKELVNEYKKLDDSSLEKPSNLRMISKSVDDLLLKDMKQEQEDYQKLYDFYQEEIYPEYVLVVEKYNNDEISKEDYQIEASKCLNHYGILNNEYNRISKEFLEYEKMFDSDISEYNVATSQELTNFYAELNEYNMLVDDYKKESNILDEIVSKDVINLERYEEQMLILDSLYNRLLSKRDKLKRQKGKIYNGNTLSILNKRKSIIESNLKNSNLTDLEIEKLKNDLEQVNKVISEINKFKSTLVIKTFKKNEKKVSGHTKQREVDDADYLVVDKATEPFFLGDNKEVNFVLVDRKMDNNIDDLVTDNVNEQNNVTYKGEIIDIQKKISNSVKPSEALVLKGVNFENNSQNYIEILDKYKELLKKYKDELCLFYDKEKRFLNGEIPYEGEYEESALGIISFYKKVKNEYDRINRLCEEKKVNGESVQEETPLSPEKPMISMGKEEPIQKVVKTDVWQWIKEHKKQILIALGLTAIAVSIIVLVTQLLPAIVAAAQASQTAGMFSQMILNAKAWHTAIASERIALHGANIALANQITMLTGMSNVFNTATGVWTIGGNVLASAATQASLVAGRAATLVSSLKIGTLIPALGGLGLVGTGLLLKDKVTESSKKKVRTKKNDYTLDESFE